MKSKSLLIATLIFFLIVNTSYYWESLLGIFSFPAFFVLALAYCALVIALIFQIYFAISEKLVLKKRLTIIGFISFVLILTFYRPFGFIDFEKFEGKDILEAEREGSANCMIILKLKDDFTFKEKSICFGVSEIKGDFHVCHDTIFFSYVKLPRGESEFYKFAVIKPSKFINDGQHFDLMRYKNLKDTIGHQLFITKNELIKLKSIN